MSFTVKTMTKEEFENLSLETLRDLSDQRVYMIKVDDDYTEYRVSQLLDKAETMAKPRKSKIMGIVGAGGNNIHTMTHIGTDTSKEIILVGAGRAVIHAYNKLIEDGYHVIIEKNPFDRNEIRIMASASEPPIGLTKLATHYYHEWTPKTAKPKHHNGRYNQVNRNKNKASRKARKQNRK